MTHPTQPDRDDASTPPDRETVARVIDPETWAAMEGRWEDDAFGRWLSDEHRAGCLGERQGYALAKADAIIALWPTREGVSGGVVDLLSDIDAWFARTLPITDEANDYINEDGWTDAEALHARILALRFHAAPPSSGGAGQGSSVAESGGTASPKSDGPHSNGANEVLIAPGALLERSRQAYLAGCCAVLTWTHSGVPQDDLDEASYDYVASLDFTEDTRPARAMDA